MLSVAGGAPLGALALVFAVTSGLTTVLTNAAAFMLVAPVALAVAGTLGADPRPFLIMTVVGAAAAFFSPAGHHSNALVYSAGGYRFSDYARVGLGLCVLLGVASLLLVPRLWPLFP
jgi:di/tricarboxylate transporter